MPEAKDMISQMYFKIDGSEAPIDLLDYVKEITVDTSLYQPDMFSLEINDPYLKWIDSPLFTIGKSVQISGKQANDRDVIPLTKGEIIAIEPELVQNSGASLSSVTIRGYDQSHRLHRGKKSRPYVNATDSDIVQQIASANGLDCKVDSTPVVYDMVLQDNRTDMEFIYERAWRAGYLAYVENGKLIFRSASAEDSAQALKWGNNLLDFQARFSSAGQVSKSEIRYWDIQKKEAFSGEMKTPEGTPTVAEVNHGGEMAAKAFGFEAVEIVNNHTILKQPEADLLAKSVLNDKCHNLFRAEGTCRGNPEVRAGKLVQIEGIGTRFSGQYLITRAIHRRDFSGYTTWFEISGYRADTLEQLLGGKEAKESYGVVVGIVTDVKDPQGLARVKVNYPLTKLDSDWARLAVPMAGKDRGIKFIPEIGDEVLVAFEYNDINKPYVIGGLWNGQDTPPESGEFGENGEVQKRVFKSRSGHVVTFDDTDKNEQISIIDKQGQKITLDSKPGSEKIEIVGKGKQKFLLDSISGKEKIEIIDSTGKSRVLMDAASQSVTIESAMNLTIKATGKVEIDGQTGVTINTAGGNLELKSNAQTNISGTQTSIQGTATAEVKANGPLVIKGLPVNIN